MTDTNEQKEKPDIQDTNEKFSVLTSALNDCRILLRHYISLLKDEECNDFSDSQVDMDAQELKFFLADMQDMFEDLHDKWPALNSCLETIHRYWNTVAPNKSE